ncbi:hypothetical protein ACEQ8H_008455 [Pleosporales sp. CAS-2024a]
MPPGPSPLRRAYYQWRMQRFPWRKKWLVGFDLQGNTFWEFKDQLHALRNRRVAKYSPSTHYGDVNVSPSWMQWLRHTRSHPPSLAEQQHDLMRQERIKMLAARAEERWASQPSVLDAPDKQQPAPMLQSRDPHSRLGHTSDAPKAPRNTPKNQVKDSPWNQAEPTKDWQPQAWTPPPAKP